MIFHHPLLIKSCEENPDGISIISESSTEVKRPASRWRGKPSQVMRGLCQAFPHWMVKKNTQWSWSNHLKLKNSQFGIYWDGKFRKKIHWISTWFLWLENRSSPGHELAISHHLAIARTAQWSPAAPDAPRRDVPIPRSLVRSNEPFGALDTNNLGKT